MVRACNFPTLDALIDATVPAAIRRTDGMDMGDPYNDGLTESQFLERFKYAPVKFLDKDPRILSQLFVSGGVRLNSRRVYVVDGLPRFRKKGSGPPHLLSPTVFSYGYQPSKPYGRPLC